MAVELTVIVKGEDGKLLENAEVTVTPGNFSAKTNSDGEATLTIDGADRYQVHVKSGDSEQTVPFYNTSPKLEVSLKHLKELKEVQGQNTDSGSMPWYQTDIAYAGYAVALVVALAIIVNMIAKKKKTKEPEAYSESEDINAEPEEVAEAISTRRAKSKKAKTTKKKK